MLGTIFLIFLTLLGICWVLSLYLRWTWGKIDPSNEEPVEGKVVLITGANAGIGKVTAEEMAKRGATVVLACRDLVSASNTICDIRRKTRNGNLVTMKLDLASLESIREFVTRFQKRFSKLHILINNAGIIIPLRHNKKSKEGYEIHFATNHLGHFLLTNLLLDQLKAGAPSRVVTLTSFIHSKGEMDFDDLMSQKKNYKDSLLLVQYPLYANSKLANALFNRELGRRLLGTGIQTYGVCPGNVATTMSRTLDIPSIFRLAIPLAFFFMKTPAEGAQTVLYCALSRSEEVRLKTGEMYRNCAYWDPADRILLRDEDGRRLWEASVKLAGLE